MRYVSTRGQSPSITFEELVFSSYAPDGGLYVPETVPIIDLATLQSMASMTYDQIAAKVLSYYVSDDIRPHLSKICKNAFSHFDFQTNINGDTTAVPLKKIGPIYVLEAFHGPTLAFKDIGLNILAQLMEYILTKRNRGRSSETIEKANVLVETSGDTGPAAVSSVVLNTTFVNIFAMFPRKQVSPIQARQLTTMMPKYNPKPNNKNNERLIIYATDKNSDDQCLVIKQIFKDTKFIKQYNICAMNSINLVRILSQITYYYWAYVQLFHKYLKNTQNNTKNTINANKNSQNNDKNSQDSNKNTQNSQNYTNNTQTTHNSHNTPNNTDNDSIEAYIDEGMPIMDVCVPSGAFGNTCALCFAKTMGLPVRYIIPSTNENDIVYRTLMKNGDFSSIESNYHLTMAPAMDVQVAYNIERFFWLSFNGNGRLINEIMSEFEINADKMVFRYKFDKILQSYFRKYITIAYKTNDYDISETVRLLYKQYGYIPCPHSVCSIYAGIDFLTKYKRIEGERSSDVPVVCVATAHASKFPEIIKKALGFDSGEGGSESGSEGSDSYEKWFNHRFLPKSSDKEEFILLPNDENWVKSWIRIVKNDIVRLNPNQTVRNSKL